LKISKEDEDDESGAGAVHAGVDGIFLEVHDDPAHAKSDGANALDLKQLKPLLEKLLAIHKTLQPNG
jgi:2-dehydro-3-deoxyphosphooctonate aldolase (KDO 8-P synthase)